MFWQGSGFRSTPDSLGSTLPIREGVTFGLALGVPSHRDSILNCAQRIPLFHVGYPLPSTHIIGRFYGVSYTMFCSYIASC